MTISGAYIRQSLTAAVLLVCVSVSAQAQQSQTAVQDPAGVDYRSEPRGLIAEPAMIERAIVFADRHFGNGELRSGFYTDFFNMVPGAGWISGGPGYRYWAAKDRLFVDGSAAISWRGYKTAQARVELPRLMRSRLTLGSQLRWQDFTQVAFYGEGPESFEGNDSEYRLKSTDLVGFATLKPVEWIDIDARIGRMKPSVLPRSGSFMRDRLGTESVFPDNIVYAVDEQPAFIHSEAAITADTRDFPSHPTRGGLLRAAVAHYSDRDTDLFSFRRYEAEAGGFVPLADSRVVIAVHGWLVTSDTAEGQFVPFYLQPSLGGSHSLRGYAEYRFHDRNLLLVNAETRVALMTHVDVAAFVDAGNVAPRVGDLNLGKRSYGAGLRFHSRRQTYARVDVARGDEGWRLLFRLTEPLNLGRLTRRTAAVPFVP